MRRIHWAIIGVVAAAALAETVLRVAGGLDFPIYATDNQMGYAPIPSQHGRFINGSEWHINSRSLSTVREWSGSESTNDVILIGDSIVWGGLPLHEDARLGPSLERSLSNGWRVWPAAVGGWSAPNEMELVRRNLDIYEQADVAVWVINSGDLVPVTPFDNDEAHPTRKPAVALYHYVRKYVLPRLGMHVSSENPPIANAAGVDQVALSQFREFVQSHRAGKTLIVLYPSADELSGAPRATFQSFSRAATSLCTETVRCVDVTSHAEWNRSLYRDANHPSAKGNEVLANIIRDEVYAQGWL